MGGIFLAGQHRLSVGKDTKNHTHSNTNPKQRRLKKQPFPPPSHSQFLPPNSSRSLSSNNYSITIIMSASNPSKKTSTTNKTNIDPSQEPTSTPNPMDTNTGVPSDKPEPLTTTTNLSDFAKVAQQYYDGWGCFALSDPTSGIVWVSCSNYVKNDHSKKA